jgi:hypothetical protein
MAIGPFGGTFSRGLPDLLGAFAMACVLGISPASVLVAIAQPQADVELIQLLERLTVRKGSKDSTVRREICEKLGLPLEKGLPPDQACLVYRIAYNDSDGFNYHAFNVFRQPGAETVGIIISRVNSRGGSFFRVGTNATLEAAVNEARPDGVCCKWSKVPVESPEAQNGRAFVLAFWRSKLADLGGEPDRVFVEDATCAKGRMRETFGDRRGRCVAP